MKQIKTWFKENDIQTFIQIIVLHSLKRQNTEKVQEIKNIHTSNKKHGA